MIYTKTPLEEVFRSVREGYIDDLTYLTQPANDGTLAPWMRLKMRMEKMVVDIQMVCDDIAGRPFQRPTDTTQYTAEDFASLDPAELAEAERISGAHCTVIDADPIGDALAMVRPPHLTKEA